MSEALKAMKKATETKKDSDIKKTSTSAKAKTTDSKNSTAKKVSKAKTKSKSHMVKKPVSLQTLANRALEKKNDSETISDSSIFQATSMENMTAPVVPLYAQSTGTVFVEPVAQKPISYGYGYEAAPQPVQRTTSEKPRGGFAPFGSVGSGFSKV